MGNFGREEVSSLVYELLEDILVRDKRSIRDDDRLVHDLHIDSDDFSFLFVPKLHEKLDIKTKPDEWQDDSPREGIVPLPRPSLPKARSTAAPSAENALAWIEPRRKSRRSLPYWEFAQTGPA